MIARSWHDVDMTGQKARLGKFEDAGRASECDDDAERFRTRVERRSAP
jgi:hypothetical protein